MKETRMHIKCDRCGKETSVGIEKSKIENGKTIETWEGLPEGWITTIDKTIYVQTASDSTANFKQTAPDSTANFKRSSSKK